MKNKLLVVITLTLMAVSFIPYTGQGKAEEASILWIGRGAGGNTPHEIPNLYSLLNSLGKVDVADSIPSYDTIRKYTLVVHIPYDRADYLIPYITLYREFVSGGGSVLISMGSRGYYYEGFSIFSTLFGAVPKNTVNIKYDTTTRIADVPLTKGVWEVYFHGARLEIISKDTIPVIFGNDEVWDVENPVLVAYGSFEYGKVVISGSTDGFDEYGHWDRADNSQLMRNIVSWLLGVPIEVLEEIPELKSLEQEVKKLKLEISKLQTAKESLESEIEALMEQRKEIKELRDEISQLKEDYNSLQANYDVLKSDHDSLQATYDSLKRDYDKFKTDYDSLKSDYNTLKSDYNSLRSSHDTLKVDYVSLKTDYSELKSKHEISVGELGTTKNLMYVFIITTIVTTIAFIATTVYFARRKPKTT